MGVQTSSQNSLLPHSQPTKNLLQVPQQICSVGRQPCTLPALAHLGCSNKIAQVKSFITRQKIPLPGPEAGSQAPLIRCESKATCSRKGHPTPMCSHMAEGRGPKQLGALPHMLIPPTGAQPFDVIPPQSQSKNKKNTTMPR